jgi:hypothetical protein
LNINKSKMYQCSYMHHKGQWEEAKKKVSLLCATIWPQWPLWKQSSSKQPNLYNNIYIYIYTHTHIYIYTHTHYYDRQGTKEWSALISKKALNTYIPLASSSFNKIIERKNTQSRNSIQLQTTKMRPWA